MANFFFDSSGLVKRYVLETGMAWIQTITEINADFLRDFLLIEVSLSRVQEAMVLAERHGLRGYDAVQLACALFLRDQGRLSGQVDPVFITADRELTAAARAEGLAVDDPNSH